MKPIIIVLLFALVGIIAVSCESDGDIEFKRYYTAGSLVYQEHCQNCHGKNGEGLSSLMPPLTDSVYLKKNSRQLSCIIQNGSNTLLLVGGKPYNNQMPPANLAPIEIAQVLTFVKNSFGNKQGLVNVNMVNADLKDCK